MTIEFFIDPQDPEPADGKVWYVKELDYIHCICTSYESASWVLLAIRLTHSANAEFRKKRDREAVWEKENASLTTRSQLAEAAIRNQKWSFQSDKELRPAIQAPESPPRATSTQSPENISDSKLDS